MVTFRKFNNSDFTQMYQWLQEPHVKEWWNDGDDTLKKVVNHYSSDTNKVSRYILLSDTNSPIGYFQYYLLSPGVVGIDQFIGCKTLLNEGIGTKAVKLFIDLIAENINPVAIVLDPEPENLRAIRCYEKVGFKFSNKTSRKNGKEAYNMTYSYSIFRKYNFSDFDNCIALFDQNCPEFFVESEKSDYKHYLLNLSEKYEVCVFNEKIVAAFGLSLNQNSMQGRLSWIIVSSCMQNHGIGSIIMDRIFKIAIRNKMSVIDIAASHKSAPFFAKFGATVVNFTHNGWGNGMHRIDMELICLCCEERLKSLIVRGKH